MVHTLHHVGLAPDRLKGRAAFSQDSPSPDLPDPDGNVIEVHQKADGAP